MDDDLRAYLDAMRRESNDQLERLLNANVAMRREIAELRRDFDNTKGFLIEDALVNGRRMSAAERRLDDLDYPGRPRGGPDGD